MSMIDYFKCMISLSNKVLTMTYINPCLGQNNNMNIDKDSLIGSFRSADLSILLTIIFDILFIVVVKFWTANNNLLNSATALDGTNA
jgi:hypothetical protein